MKCSIDPSFDPRAAYRLPLWGAGVASGLIGKALHLAQPLVADDDAIAPTLAQAAVAKANVQSVSALIDSGATTLLWGDLRRDLASRLGAGLRRRTSSVPVLLAPANYGGLGFNDFAQTYEWEAFDQRGDRLLLILPGEAHELARRLTAGTGRPPLVLAETAGELERPALRPITVFFNGVDGLQVINLNLDNWPHSRGLRATIDAAKEIISRRAAPPASMHNPLLELARRALGAAVSICAGARAADMGKLARVCEAAGLVALADAVDRMDARRDSVSALATAYLSSEIMAGLNWV